MPTVNAQVAASADDAFEAANGTMNTTSNTIGTFSSGGPWGGMRFAGVAVPQAAPISLAQLQMYSVGTTNDSPVADFYGEAADNAASFTGSSGNISSRARTTAKTSVSAADVGVGWYSVDVTSIVQEIVNRAGWVSGNAMVLILDALTGIAWNFQAYDGNSSLAAKLDITYADAGGLPVKASYYAQMRGA